jgi:hypothetical protein
VISRPGTRLSSVVVEVLLEVAFEAGGADVQVADEGGPPAFLEDQPMESFDCAVGLWAAGADQRVADAELAQRRAKVVGAEFAAVIGEDALQLPARRRELGGDSAGEL